VRDKEIAFWRAFWHSSNWANMDSVTAAGMTGPLYTKSPSTIRWSSLGDTVATRCMINARAENEISSRTLHVNVSPMCISLFSFTALVPPISCLLPLHHGHPSTIGSAISATRKISAYTSFPGLIHADKRYLHGALKPSFPHQVVTSP
jgi:hypothetical protein